MSFQNLTLKSDVKLLNFVFLLSFLNFAFFHFPFFQYVYKNIDVFSLYGAILFVSLLILVVILNALVFYLFFYINKLFGKILLILFFIINAVTVYFIMTYNVIIDESMVGNITNTNWDESSSFFSIKMIIYLIFMGILPAILIFKTKIVKVPIKTFLKQISVFLVIIIILVGINAKNILWIDKNSKYLGGLAMPWSYVVNTILFHKHESKKNRKEILLPNLTIKNKEKAIMVLVIGESARSQNFSLYGYSKNTNPLLSKMKNLYHFNAQSCTTYTTASLKCILEHTSTDELYEILPNYLNRNGVDVVWRTTNWGEPPVNIEKFQRGSDLKSKCLGDNCSYDEILLSELKQEILACKKDKILIVLHTSTNHGPSYNKKYPPQFEVFKPVCKSVELGNCSTNELFNAYDNTIVYTDYLLAKVIENLRELKDYKSSMLYVSDHGESLGEKNLYMHGLPMSIAPKEQYEIPFIVWTSDNSTKLKQNNNLTQNYVFHSVLKFLSLESPIYKEEMSIYE